MENLTYILYICLVVPMCFLILMLEKKSKVYMLYMIIGLTISLFSSELNTIFLNLFDDDLIYVTTVITPVSEELLKLLPILFFACVFSDKQEFLIPVSLFLGIGFATFENMTILIQNIDNVTIGWALVRGFSSSLVHGICTMTVGFGLSFTRKNRKLFYCGLFAIITMVCVYHGIFNMLIQSKYNYVAVVLPVITYVPFIIQQYKYHKNYREMNA